MMCLRRTALLAAAAAAVAAAGEKSVFGAAQRADVEAALCSDSACKSEPAEGSSGVQLLQTKANAAAAASAASSRSVVFPDIGGPLPHRISVDLMQRSRKGFSQKLTGPDLCKEKPQECGDPLHCEIPVTPQEKASWYDHYAVNGHANIRSWCGAKHFTESIVEWCLVKKDLTTAGHVAFQEQMDQHALDADGSYCFLVGHCDNDKVTNATTLEDAEAMCTERYGDAWTKIGQKDMHPLKWVVSGAMNLKSGFHDRKIAEKYAMLACAMGNFHCDVVYCRENYCNKPFYQEKYAKYRTQDPEPGHLFGVGQ